MSEEQNDQGTNHPRNETSTERNVQNLCFVPGNKTSCEQEVQSPLLQQANCPLSIGEMSRGDDSRWKIIQWQTILVAKCLGCEPSM